MMVVVVVMERRGVSPNQPLFHIFLFGSLLSTLQVGESWKLTMASVFMYGISSSLIFYIMCMMLRYSCLVGEHL